MCKKQLYEQPSAELFVVRFEENIMSGENGTEDSEVKNPFDEWDN